MIAIFLLLPLAFLASLHPSTEGGEGLLAPPSANVGQSRTIVSEWVDQLMRRGGQFSCVSDLLVSPPPPALLPQTE